MYILYLYKIEIYFLNKFLSKIYKIKLII